MNKFDAEPTSTDWVKALLEETDCYTPPTSEEAFAEYLGLEIVYFRSHEEYELNSRIKAFLWVDKRLIGIYDGLTKVQKRFSIFHEIGHFVLHNGHPDLVDDRGRINDDHRTMSSTNEDDKKVYLQEIEANQFAADCIFQLDYFDKYITKKNLSWLNIRLAASEFRASIESTARRWIERINDAHALVAFNPANRTEPFTPLEVKYTIASNQFTSKYFASLTSGQQVSENSAVHKLYHRLDFLDDEPDEILSVNMGNKIVDFDMQLFSNSYRVFGILTPIE